MATTPQGPGIPGRCHLLRPCGATVHLTRAEPGAPNTLRSGNCFNSAVFLCKGGELRAFGGPWDGRKTACEKMISIFWPRRNVTLLMGDKGLRVVERGAHTADG